MKSFPKKYKPQELYNRAKNYKELNKNKDNNYIFSIWDLPISEKLSYTDFFYIYVRDFFDYINNQKKENFTFKWLFITSNNQLKNICSWYEFFNKKNQSLQQVWVHKLKRRIISTSKKNLNVNNKILESYLSTPHKIFIPDSDLYLFILEEFRKLWDLWRFNYEKKICYRSFKLQTSIPLQHITRKEEKKPYYVLKYFVWAKCEALPVYIDDIDLCCWDVALLVHPKDKRYNKYIWKNAIIPLCNRQIPIIGDENVNIALNNWIQRVCPCSDQESISIAEKYGLPTNIFVFNKQWLYTECIHEHAFIWQERDKYYNNIEWFIKDIWNLEKKWEKVVKIPYLSYINESLTPYKINQISLNLSKEKQIIINKIFNNELKFSFIDSDFWKDLKKINSLQEELNEKKWYSNEPYEETESINNLENEISELKQKIIERIDKHLPDHIILNSQLQYWWRIPLTESDWNISFFDIEKECINTKEDPLQICFNFVLLSLIRIWAFWIENNLTKNNRIKLCELDKFNKILSENEKKIQYFIKKLSEITWDNPEYERFSHIVENLINEDSTSTNDCLNLIKKSKFLEQEWTWLSTNLTKLSNDVFDNDFIQLCIPCYLHNKNIKTNQQIIFNKKDYVKIFKELLIQELLLWQTIWNEFMEVSYNKDEEFLWDKQLTKLQLEQSQRDLFTLYWENPIRLNFLIDKTYDQKQILLNNIFLKQIRNATRLCIQKDFLPDNTEKTLNQELKDFEDLDIYIIYNLQDLYNQRKSINTYDEYISFFIKFKYSIQDLFFSRYLEIQKIRPSKNIQFICSYFFSFLSNVLYPLVPEFIDALQYISDRNLLIETNPIKLEKSINYNMHLIYDTFVKIKNIKIECNIKQHEPCNIFIKSNPTISELFTEYEQIFINYFHISDISYLRLHEQSPLWYETFPGDTITIWIQSWDNNFKEKESLDSIEKEIKNLDDKLNLLRQRLQLLPEWEDRKKAEEEYAKTKEEIENLTIKHSLLSSK